MSKLVLHSQVTGERIHLHVQSNGRLLVTVDDVTFPVEIRMEAVKGAKVPAVPRIWVPGLDDRKPAPVAAPVVPVEHVATPAVAVTVPVVETAAPAVVEAEKPAETVVSDSATRRRRRGATVEESTSTTSEDAQAAPVPEVRGEP